MLDFNCKFHLAALVCDNRILSAQEAQDFAQHADPSVLPALTVSLLQRHTADTSRLLGQHATSLSQLLESRQRQLETSKDSKA